MALLVLADNEARRALRRERLFRDRRNPLDSLLDDEIFRRYRFTRNGIMQLAERVGDCIQHETRRLNKTLPGSNLSMCLTAFVLNPDPGEGGYRLILAFNRDEDYGRPTEPAVFWDRNADIIGSQDMFIGKEGGTWLGLSRAGRLAMLLNIKQPDGINPDAKGRGFLVSDFLESSLDGQTYLQGIAKEWDAYNGCNLITVEFGDNGNIDAYYWTNHAVERKDPVKLNSGLHAFSNHPINTSWPKTDHVRTELEKTIHHAPSLTEDELTGQLLEMMARDVPLISDANISKEDMDVCWFKDLLRELVFIKSNTYGTRTTTVILIDANGRVSFTERTLKEPIDPAHLEWEQRTHTFSLRSHQD